MKIPGITICACGLLLTPGQLLAQETAEDDEPVLVCNNPPEPIIVTANGSPSDPENVGQAVTFVDSKLIEQRQPAAISDLLATLPGVAVTNTGPMGGFSAVRIRGAEGEQTLVLIDGVRVNDPASPGAGFDFANLLTGNIDHVEVLRGANSVPWGSQAIGGIINISTRKPYWGEGGGGRIEYGSNDRFSLSGNGFYGTPKIRASLGGGYFVENGISAAASGSEADGYRQYAANGRLEVELSNQATVDLRGYYANGKADMDGFPPPIFDLADTTEYSTAKQFVGYAGLKLQAGKLKNRIAVTLNDVNRDNYASPVSTAPDFLSRGRSERFEYKGDWEIQYGLRALFGAEHDRSRFFDGVQTAKTHVSGAYAQIVAEPIEYLTLTAGARLDDHKTFGSKATFSANAVWGIKGTSADTYVRAAYSEGFKSPTLYQLHSFYGDETLKPENAKSYEVGIEHLLTYEHIRLAVTAWRRQTNNQIDFDLSSYRYNNIARSRGKGLEFELEFRPNSDLTLVANYSYTDSEGRQDNAANYSRLLRRPVHSLNLAFDWTGFNDKLKLGTSLRMVSDSLDGFGGSIRLDGFALASVRAAFDLSNSFEIYGRIENIFDAEYQTVAGYNAYGRNAHIGVRMKF